MSPRLRALSAREVIRALETFGFEVVATRGSHAKLRRARASGADVLTIPLHKELPPGTVRAIYRQATRSVGEEQLRPFFFSE
jgi:predicted RNA binding protein YcfA (HicA-like mRNA interferase family)